MAAVEGGYEPVAVVTGANTGIGLAVAHQLCAEGFLVVLGCRDPARGEAACAALHAVGGRCELRLLDLASLASVDEFAAGLVAWLGCSRGRRLRLLVRWLWLWSAWSSAGCTWRRRR